MHQRISKRHTSWRASLKFGLFGGFAMAMFYGCTNMKLTNMWRDPSFETEPMNNMLIVAMKRNQVNRRLLEDGFVAELREHGVLATPSYRLFPKAMPDTIQVDAVLGSNEYDGVLIVRRLRPQMVTREIPGYTTAEPVTRYHKLTNTYHTYYREVHHPGYTETERLARHQTDLWTTRNGGHLVWAGTGEILDPSSRQAINSEIIELMVPELARQGFISKKK